MIRIILSFALLLISTNIFAQDTTNKGVEIKVSINDFANDKGVAVFSLFQEKGFLDEAIQKIEMEIVDGKAIVTFKNVSKGTYAVLCHHDVNQNSMLDFQENGMPTEDIGISNSVIRFGPPKFNKAKFEVDAENLEIEIKF